MESRHFVVALQQHNFQFPLRKIIGKHVTIFTKGKSVQTVNELSDYLQVSKHTIYSWVWQKRIPYTKIGHLLRFDLRVIDQWIKENSVARFEIVDTDSTVR